MTVGNSLQVDLDLRSPDHISEAARHELVQSPEATFQINTQVYVASRPLPNTQTVLERVSRDQPKPAKHWQVGYP